MTTVITDNGQEFKVIEQFRHRGILVYVISGGPEHMFWCAKHRGVRYGLSADFSSERFEEAKKACRRSAIDTMNCVLDGGFIRAEAISSGGELDE